MKAGLTSGLLAAALVSSVAAAAPGLEQRPFALRHPPAAGRGIFRELTPAETGLTVANVYNDPRMWGDRFREFTLGAIETGLAVADFDRDGWLDIYVVSKDGPCALYRQTAPFKFTDIAGAAGVDCAHSPAPKVGATVVDINQDGWPDIYVCRYDAPNLLFVNNGDGTFTERAHQYGLDVKDASVMATFADYDGDGFLDCYLVTNILDFSKSSLGRRDYLFHNQGDGTFTDVTQKAGIWGLTQGHSAIWFDANQDGWPDLYVANDFETPDRFYLNQGDGTFVDVVGQRLPHVPYFSMSADSGDLNNDGRIDFMVVDMRDHTRQGYMAGMEEVGRGLWEVERPADVVPQYPWSAVFLGTGTDHYQEAAHLTGMVASGWTWATRIADLDNDGRQDVFLTTGMIRNFVDPDIVDKQNLAPTLAARAAVWKNVPPRREHPLAYHNLGELKFEDVSAAWGFDHLGVAFGCALVDLDNDGALDIVFVNQDGPPTVYRNETATGHSVEIKLAGQAPNRDGIGAEIRVETATGTQVRQLYTERGVVTSEPPIVHFGLGDDPIVKKLTIRWPLGDLQVFENLPADCLCTIAEPPFPAGQRPRRAPAILKSPGTGALYVETAPARGLDYTSAAQPYDEFFRQRLLPRRLGQLAPALAVADVNGDGIDDLFVSGGLGQAGALYLGQPDGSFVLAPNQPWADAKEADDVGAVFFDANGDGKVDLFIAAGGVASDRGDARLNDRLYLGDGHGGFSAAPSGMLPADGESTAACAAADFDGDHKIDLFVGGRVVPGKWPATPRSFLYRNVGGHFEDVTDQLAPGLRNVGMVTAAAWADLDGDGRPDLVLAIEWGPVKVFHNTGAGFEDYTARLGLAGVTGWWSALAVADVNGDGRPDLIAGNVGLNTKYSATPDAPAVLFTGDLDGSGRTALVEAGYDPDGGLYPLRGRSKLAQSFPWLRQKFPSFAEFSRATVASIFPPAGLGAATRLTATELASGVFLQQADGAFRFTPLPRPAQLAPINGFVAADLDGDGLPDLYCVGNFFGPEPMTGRFDGGVSLLLRGDGHGHFTPVSPAESGLVAIGDARAVARLSPVVSGDGPRLAVAQSQGPLLLFTRNPR
jgi:enediyne biosynthesis protein E4